MDCKLIVKPAFSGKYPTEIPRLKSSKGHQNMYVYILYYIDMYVKKEMD